MDAQRGPAAPRMLYVPKEDTELRRIVLQETRYLLLDLLKRPRADGKSGWSVQDLARRLTCTTQNIHHHLKILEERGLARVAAEEETNGLARQYWTTDVQHVYTDMAPEAKAALVLDKARAHHNPSESTEGYYERHFQAMAHLGAAVPRDRWPELTAFYRRESGFFEAAFRGMEPRLQEAAARWGVAETKAALHFATLAQASDEEFEAWVEGLRALRRATRVARARPGSAAVPVPGGATR